MPTATVPLPRPRVPEAFRTALTPSGIQKRASGHTLRHSEAPHLLEAGGHLRLLQDYGGHHPPTTTALSTPLTATADAMARAALAGLGRDLCVPLPRRHHP
jgi:site-specific recombinase XerD